MKKKQITLQKIYKIRKLKLDILLFQVIDRHLIKKDTLSDFLYSSVKLEKWRGNQTSGYPEWKVGKLFPLDLTAKTVLEKDSAKETWGGGGNRGKKKVYRG